MKKYIKPEVEICLIDTPQVMTVSTLMNEEYNPSLPLNADELHFDFFDEE